MMKIDYPTFTVNLPISKHEIQLRVMTLREEKIILTAQEGGNVLDLMDAMIICINNCLLSKIDLHELPFFELQYIYLHLRSNSVGLISKLLIPDDYEKLKPKLVLSNGPLAETWNTVRTFSSTMKNNSNIGRNLYYTVVDEVTDKYLGVMCISSDFLDLTPRDTAIGWPRDVKTQQGMINHTAIGSTIVPLQPLGFNYMGGKLLALLCLADTVQNDWKRQYIF